MKMHTAPPYVNQTGQRRNPTDPLTAALAGHFQGGDSYSKPHTHKPAPVFYESPDSVQVAMTLDALGLLEKLHRERADLTWASLTPAHSPLVRELGVLGLVTCDGDNTVTLTDWGRSVFGAYQHANGSVVVRVPPKLWSAPYSPRHKHYTGTPPAPAAPPCPPPTPPKPSKPPIPKPPTPKQPNKPPTPAPKVPRRPILSQHPDACLQAAPVFDIEPDEPALPVCEALDDGALIVPASEVGCNADLEDVHGEDDEPESEQEYWARVRLDERRDDGPDPAYY